MGGESVSGFRNVSFKPERQSGNTRPRIICGARIFKYDERGIVCVTKYVVALFVHCGMHKYRFKNLVNTASNDCFDEFEQFDIHQATPKRKIGDM